MNPIFKIASYLLLPLQRAGALVFGGGAPIALVSGDSDPAERERFMERFRFFSASPDDTATFTSRLDWRTFLSMRPVLQFDATQSEVRLLRCRNVTFDVDPERNPDEGWAWCRFSRFVLPKPSIEADAHSRFRARVERLRHSGHEKCYLFGTGPSLAGAIDRDWSDGYRVVCNTIVRDDCLWRHIDPHFIVAGDAIYHFGFTPFARAFRADLAKRLRESDAFFVFPRLFSSLVQREFSEFADRLIPVPFGWHQDIHVDLARTFRVPRLGNVLNLLLLPLGCTLSRDVRLWGFDGRAPDDKLFWSNSSMHSYPELMDSLQQAHPAFFRHHVPADRPTSYAQRVHGDQLETALANAEAKGWRFTMMHRTWTPTLQKRYLPENE